MRTIHELYDAAPALQRIMASHRHRICPTEPILAHIPADSSILDVGCGIGFFMVTFALHDRVKRGVGFDINPHVIAVAQATAAKLPDVDLRFLCDQTVTALDEEPFDVVTMIDVIHHIPPEHQKSFFCDCFAAIAPGGRMVFKDMAQRPLWMSLFNRLHDLTLARQIIHYVPLETIKQWAAEMGFFPVVEQSYHKLAYAHELLVLERRDPQS